LRRRLAITFETAGGLKLGLNFKRRIVENRLVDMPEALALVDLINRRIVAG
jgi:hypothetical protein